MSSVAFACKSLRITGTTESTSILSGALRCSGTGARVDVSGAIVLGGNIVAEGITGNTFSTPNTYTVTDGANTGTIDQVSTELTLSSNGNKVSIDTGNTLDFNNDGTSQRTAYTGRELVDDCNLFTSIWNINNPSNLVYALSSTFALTQTMPTTLAISVNTIYAFPVRLVKGEIVNGAKFYLITSGSPQVRYALYDTANPGARLASTNLTTVSSNVATLINFTSSYTVPTTGIYFICLYATSIGSSLSAVTTPQNSRINFGLGNSVGFLNKAAQTGATATVFPATLSGITFSALSQVAHAVVYTLTP